MYVEIFHKTMVVWIGKSFFNGREKWQFSKIPVYAQTRPDSLKKMLLNCATEFRTRYDLMFEWTGSVVACD